MQETTIVGMIPMQETTNIVANVKDCLFSIILSNDQLISFDY